jgi:hypothetical protein
MYRDNCENNHKNLKLRQKGKPILIPPNQTNKILKLISMLRTIVPSMKENGNQVLMTFKKEMKKENYHHSITC